jgi:hypothetical protein
MASLDNFGVNTVNFNGINGIPQTTAISNPSQYPTTSQAGALERSPQADDVSLTNKKPMSKQSKILVAVGGLATAVLGTALAIKGYKSHKIAKALEQIEQKFVNLKENIPEVQKTFKDVFLRSDITEKETVEMLDRYKDIEKLGVTGTKEEYIQAVFKEAKRNFGFEDCNFELKFEADKILKKHRTLAAASGVSKEVTIDPSIEIAQVQNAMHHEMRHMKQHYFAVNYDPQAFVEALSNRDMSLGFLPKVNLSKKQWDEVLEASLDDLKESFNLKDFSKDNVPAELRRYTQKCIDAQRDYADPNVDYDKYWNSFVEVDARFAGESMAKLFGLRVK